MNIILLSLNTALVLVCALCVLACIQMRGKIAYLIAAYIVSYADIVLVLELAGLLSAISPMPVLGLQLALTIACVLAWFRMGKPRLLEPFAGLRIPRPSIRSLLRIVQQAPLLSALIIVLAGSDAYVYARHAEMVLVVPPNVWDSLTYRLSRVGYWLQYRSFYPWPTSLLHQTTLPMNAELGVLWTILWWGTDRLAGFVQWMTVPVIVLGIYGIVCQLGYRRRDAVLVALLWPTLAQVLYQSSTTQNDMLTAGFCVATVYFFFASWRERAGPYLYMSGLALGLAIGTKDTSFLILPGLACASLLILWLRRREREFRLLMVRWMAAGVLGVLLFGSYSFVQNAIAFGSPLGPMGSRRGPGDLATVDFNSPDLIPTMSSLLRDNVGRYVYQLVDFSPLPPAAAKSLNAIKAAVFTPIFQVLQIPIENKATAWTQLFSLKYFNLLNEDEAWFGPLGAVLMLAVIQQSVGAVRRREPLRLTLVLIAIGFLASQSALQLWTRGNGRYYLVATALAFPLMADFLDISTRRSGRKIVLVEQPDVDRMTTAGEKIELAPEGQQVLENAVDEARRLGDHSIGSGHVLLGLVRVDGTALEVLRALGVTAHQIREQTLRVLNRTASAHPAAGPEPAAPTAWRGVLASALVFIGLTVMFNLTLTNITLQGVSWRQVFAGSREPPAWASEFDYRMLNENVPQNASIGVVSLRDVHYSPLDVRDYPFFGEHFTRQVTRALPDDGSIVPNVDTARFAANFQNSDFLSFEGRDSHFIPDLAEKAFDLLSVHNGNSLWIRRDLRSPNDCDDTKWPFTEFFRSSNPRVCARFPIDPGTAADDFRGVLLLENGDYIPEIGTASQASLRFSLLVTQPTKAKIVVEVVADRAMPQTLQLILSREGSQPMLFSAPFYGDPLALAFNTNTQLLPGIYNVELLLKEGEKASIQRFRVMPPESP